MNSTLQTPLKPLQTPLKRGVKTPVKSGLKVGSNYENYPSHTPPHTPPPLTRGVTGSGLRPDTPRAGAGASPIPSPKKVPDREHGSWTSYRSQGTERGRGPWTEELVGLRMVEAYRIVARMPMTTKPKEYGNSWPRFVVMTSGEIQQLLNEAQLAGTLGALYADQNRTRCLPSSLEIQSASEALAWPMRYLREDRDLALLVTGWADGMFHGRAYNPGVEISELVKDGLGVIAVGLNRDRVRVR